MKNLRNVFASLTLSAVLAFATFSAQAGILMTDNAAAKTNDKAPVTDGVVIVDLVSSALFTATGIIVHDLAVVAKEGVVIVD